MLLFHGCRTNDEAIKSERQIQGAEYSSKTLWNEDEKYIKNVIKIYDQYKETVSKSTQIKGEPFWDYAMTMGQFNESYLEVPVVNQEKVVQILRVIRKGSKVYFSSNSTEKASLDFFQQLIFGSYTTIKGKEERKGKIQNAGAGSMAMGQVVCVTRTVSMWYPDKNNDPDGPGHWESMSETRCTWVEQVTDTIIPCIDCSDGGLPEGPGGVGLPYIDEANKIDIEQLKDFPCAYSLALQLTNENIGGDLARLLKETFGVNERVNINFISSDSQFLGKNVSGGFRFTGDANNFNGNVYLNKDILSNATQNYLLATLYHEVVHGYLDYERNRLGESQFNIQYPEMQSYDVKLGDGTTIKKFLFIGTDQNHNRMGPFINGIKQAVINFDPSYPPNRAEALAMGGLIAESSLPPGYSSVDSHEAEGSTAALGKKCSN